MDGLAGAEFNGGAAHSDLLPPGAGEVHFDAPALGVVESVMLERTKIEVGAEFAVDAAEQIEIEFRSHTGGVVVGAIEDVGRLDEIDPDQESSTGAEQARGAAQKCRRLVRLEITDRGAGK